MKAYVESVFGKLEGLIKKKRLKKLLRELVTIKYKGPTHPKKGICGNLSKGWMVKEIATHFSSWEYFSGDSYLPIPSVTKGLDIADVDCSREYYMWGDSEYARLRYKLLDHLIKEVRKEYCSL